MAKEFQIGNMADDLVELTLQLCGKDQDHTPRFPERFYDSYVTRMAKGKCEKKNRHLRCMARDLSEGKLTPEKFAERYFGWRLHALKGDTGSMVRSTDQRMNARLNKIGYQLRIVKHAGGKVHWRVAVEPLGGKTCQEQSQI